MRWPWSKPKLVVRLDAEMHADLKQWAKERQVKLDDLVRDVLRAVLPTRFQVRAPDPGKTALDAAYAVLDESDRELGILAAELAPVKAASFCLYLHPEVPGMFRPGECAGTCHHSSQSGRPCFWYTVSARLCSLYQPTKIPLDK